MARIKPPADFKIVGPWLKRNSLDWDTDCGQLPICSGTLGTLFKDTKTARRVRLTLSTEKPSRPRRRVQFLCHAILKYENNLWHWRSRGRSESSFWRKTNLYLTRKFRILKMKDGDTISLWLSAETR